MKDLFAFLFLGVMLFAETKAPLLPLQSNRWYHATQNISIKFFNVFIVYLIFLILKSFGYEQVYSSGLLSKFQLPFLIKIIIVFLVCDFFMYASHVLDHKLSFLWRIHRVHHSDRCVDATTTYRTHIGEVLVGDIMFLFFIFPVFGISLDLYFLYQIVSSFVITFHHSNVSLPGKLDDTLSLLIVTPNMHKVHHSNLQLETDSNYGSLFSFWDRLFGTYRIKKTKDIVFGLKEFADNKGQDFLGLLSMPFST